MLKYLFMISYPVWKKMVRGTQQNNIEAGGRSFVVTEAQGRVRTENYEIAHCGIFA